MHSILSRVNTVLTFFGTVCAVLAILTTCTDYFHRPDPKINVALREVKRLVPHMGARDQALVTFDLDADLSSAFSWNTKQLFVYLQAEYETPSNAVNQVVLWDRIIQSKQDARIKLIRSKTKYPFVDRGKGLLGRRVNLTLSWNVMPRVGALYTSARSFDVGPLPDQYKA